MVVVVVVVGLRTIAGFGILAFAIKTVFAKSMLAILALLLVAFIVLTAGTAYPVSYEWHFSIVFWEGRRSGGVGIRSLGRSDVDIFFFLIC